MSENYPTERKLCGIFYRVKRDDIWKNVCISDMSEQEINELFAGIDTNTNSTTYYKNLSKSLIQAIREIGDKLNIIAE